MARALAAASVPVFIALSPGGYHSGYHTLMAMPHCAMAQPGSAAATAVNCFAASSYQNEWSTAKARSEEHTSELQSRQYLVCRLLLEKKKKKNRKITTELTHRS